MTSVDLNQSTKFFILASQSPRRAEILKNARYFFVPFPVYVSEIPQKNLSLDEQIIDIARRKASSCYEKWTDKSLDAVILASDTMVCIAEKDESGQSIDRPLGKPEDEKQAFDFLNRLSGQEHEVKTALILIDLKTQKEISHIETTKVFFKNLSDKDIRDYIQSGEPMDKAGAYAIQGLGKKFVDHFEGDYNNVVGLPLSALEKIITINKWQMRRT